MAQLLLLLNVIISLLLLSSCSQKAEPETYLIPATYAGKVNILLNKKDGAAKKYEGGRRVYEIPADGILVSQFKVNDGLMDREYYSVDGKGKRTRLEVFKYKHREDGSFEWIVKDKEAKGIFNDGISGQYGNTGSSQAMSYQEFTVSNYATLDSFLTKQYQISFNERLEKITGLNLTSK